MSSRHLVLLSEPDVKRWHTNLAAGSKDSARVYLTSLHFYCEYRGLSPIALVNEFKQSKKKAEDGLQDYIQTHLRTKAPKTKNLRLSVVKNWLHFNECDITRDINCGDQFENPTTDGEQVPTLEDFRRTMELCNIRTKVGLGLIATSGLRFKSIELLTLGNLHGLSIEMLDFKPDELIRINVPASASKNKRPYFVWMLPMTADWLIRYLRQRKDDGEELTTSSSILVAGQNVTIGAVLIKKGEGIGRQSLAAEIRRAMEAASVKGRPYVWRSFYTTRLQNANIPHTWELFWTGHKGDIQATYSTNKRLSDEQVETMRKAYVGKVIPLFVGGSIISEVELSKKIASQTRLDMLTSVGYTKEEIAMVGDLGTMSSERFAELYALKSQGYTLKEYQEQRPILGVTSYQRRMLESPDPRHPLSDDELAHLYDVKEIDGPKPNAQKYDVVDVKRDDRKRIIELVGEGWEKVPESDFNGSCLYRRPKSD